MTQWGGGPVYTPSSFGNSQGCGGKQYSPSYPHHNHGGGGDNYSPPRDRSNKGGDDYNKTPPTRIPSNGGGGSSGPPPPNFTPGDSLYPNRDVREIPTFDDSHSGPHWNSISHSSGGRSNYKFRPKFNLKQFGQDNNYSIEEFISVMNDYIRINMDSAEPDDIAAAAKSYLTGEAMTIILDAEATTWSGIKKALLAHYRPAGEDRTHMAKLLNMRRQNNETPASLAIRVRYSTKKAHPLLTLPLLDNQMIVTFLQAMGDKDLERLVIAHDIRDFKQVVDTASRLDLAGGNDTSNDKFLKKPSAFRLSDERSLDERDEALIARVSSLVLKTNESVQSQKGSVERGRSRERHYRDSNKSHGSSLDRHDRSHGRRDNSRISGVHRARSYTRHESSGYPRSFSGRRESERTYERRGSSSRYRSLSRQRSYSNSGTCYKCHGMGHYIVDCPAAHWFRKDGSIDHERDQMENYRVAHCNTKQQTNSPNGKWAS